MCRGWCIFVEREGVVVLRLWVLVEWVLVELVRSVERAERRRRATIA